MGRSGGDAGDVAPILNTARELIDEALVPHVRAVQLQCAGSHGGVAEHERQGGDASDDSTELCRMLEQCAGVCEERSENIGEAATEGAVHDVVEGTASGAEVQATDEVTYVSDLRYNFGGKAVYASCGFMLSLTWS